MHFGDGERLFYGQVQDAAVPIRQALADNLEPDSPPPAPDSASPSARKQDCAASVSCLELCI